MVFFYSRNSQKYKYSAKQGWIPRKNKRDSKRSRIYPATCDYGDIAGMIEDFQGALTFEDIVDKFSIPQLMIMRMDKPTVDYDDDEQEITSAEQFMNILNKN